MSLVMIMVTWILLSYYAQVSTLYTLEDLDGIMKSLIELGKVPGAQLAVAKEGQLKYFKAFGIANTDTSEPVTTDHVMRYNSISKVLTGTAILKLIQEGKLSFEEKPFHMLEHLHPPTGAKMDERILNITIRNLLQHTGGWNSTSSGIVLTMPGNLMVSQSLGTIPPPKPTEMIRFMKGLPLNFEPGTGMEYSSFGYIVLGRIIENVTGLPYEEYIDKEFLSPLGLKSIKPAKTRSKDLAPNEVRYYGIDGVDFPFVSVYPHEGFMNLSYGFGDYRSGDSSSGWLGNARDVVRFVDHMDGLRKPGILKEEVIHERLNAEMPSNRGTLMINPLMSHPKGLDVFVSVDEHGNVVSFQHPGSGVGAHSFFMRVTDVNVTFCFLLNTLPSSPLFDIWAAGNISNVVNNIGNWPTFDLHKP